MNINVGNILIILIGIALCFFGIYFKRIGQILMGFGWGVLLAWLFLLVLSARGIMNEENEAIAILIVLLVGALMAFLAVKLERLLVTIQGVLLSLLITVSVLVSIAADASMAFVVALSLLVAVITGCLMWMYYRYAFICETAIIGSIMINHIWLLGGEELNAFSVIFTIIVATAGIKVQSMWLKKIEGGITKKRINMESVSGSLKKSSIQGSSFSGLFSNGDVYKSGMVNLCTYEKCMVIIPIITFFIDKIVLNYLYSISDASMAFFDSTWQMRSYLRIILEGAFAGCILYFVIYYEFKVAALYQLHFYMVLL